MIKSPFIEYVEMFNENFPVWAPMPAGKTALEVAKECVEKRKKYVPKYKSGKDY